MKTATNAAVSLSHVHVLILDDDAGSRVRIHHALRVMGVMHVTEVASDGTAKSIPSIRTVDLVITDLALGLGNGLALLKAIRLGRVPGIRADVPFIFISDVAYPRMISAAAKLDANGFVIRPLQTERLRTMMLRALKHHFRLAPEKYAKVDIANAMRLSAIAEAGDAAGSALGSANPNERARF
ncbi:MAG: response regulator [Rhodospirillaceae bacterium]